MVENRQSIIREHTKVLLLYSYKNRSWTDGRTFDMKRDLIRMTSRGTDSNRDDNESSSCNCAIAIFGRLSLHYSATP